MNKIGWLGTFLLTFCGVPELILALQTGTCLLSWPFLLMWFFGEVFILIPVVTKIKTPFLVANYAANIIIIALLMVIKGELL